MKNNMICDIEKGICGVGDENDIEIIEQYNLNSIIDLYYVTDPICSHCWALEPVLNRFIEQYGHYFNLNIVMGGLLESWNDFADVSNGISAPSDVASHWKEVGIHSRMPIDGSLWYNNPVQSSYPASRVFKVIQKNNKELAKTFLRKTREAVFAFNQNVGDNQVLIDIVNNIGLNGTQIVEEANQPSSNTLLNEDFALANKLGVRGFPTIIMINKENKGVKIVGARSLEDYINALIQVLPNDERLQPKTQPELIDLLTKNDLLFSKEIEVMYDIIQDDVLSYVKETLTPYTYELNSILGEVYIKKM